MIALTGSISLHSTTESAEEHEMGVRWGVEGGEVRGGGLEQLDEDQDMGKGRKEDGEREKEAEGEEEEEEEEGEEEGEEEEEEEGEEGGGLFEGDIEINEGTLREYYDKSLSEVGVVLDQGPYPLTKRAAIREKTRQWPEGIVPYTIGSYAPASTTKKIRKAIEHWQWNTCVRFTPRTTEEDFVHFTSLIDRCSSHIGRAGGNQTVKVWKTCSFGNIVHEIGHVIGFWHEHSRPDRNSYIRVITKNIKRDKENNFLRRTHEEVHSQQVGYDFGSILHYSTTSFASCNTKSACPTLAIQNYEEYRRQGRPTIGQRKHLSSLDILQANRLYQCGMVGSLKLLVKYAEVSDFTSVDRKSWDGIVDSFVIVSVVDAQGATKSKQTSIKADQTIPVWREWLDFGIREWRAIELSIWDATRSRSGAVNHDNSFRLFGPSRIPIQVGVQRWSEHCSNLNCSNYVVFDYHAIADGNECNPDPCHPGGNCTDLLVNYTCTCYPGYHGRNCDIFEGPGHLRVFARVGYNLPKADYYPIVQIRSDPYMEFVAINRANVSSRRMSSVKINTGHPQWNEWLDFGIDTWKELQVTVWDRDFVQFRFRHRNRDDRLTKTESWAITLGDHKALAIWTLYSRGGIVEFDYYFH